jgi:hypothetical protein
MSRACANCRNWNPPPTDITNAVYGECRYNAPCQASNWPLVKPTDWCGKHEADSRTYGHDLRRLEAHRTVSATEGHLALMRQRTLAPSDVEPQLP